MVDGPALTRALHRHRQASSRCLRTTPIRQHTFGSGRRSRRPSTTTSTVRCQAFDPAGDVSLASSRWNLPAGDALMYLLIHAVASHPPFDVALPASIWARALGMRPSPSAAAQISQISATLSWLEARALIATERDGRARRITLLADDGSGRKYVHPARERGEHRAGHLKLPYAYWLDEWHRSLDLSATTVLLIALSLPKTFLLPQHTMPRIGTEFPGIRFDAVCARCRRWA